MTKSRVEASAYVLVVYILLMVKFSDSSDCPTGCQCGNEAPFLTSCIDKGLSEVPSGIPGNTEELYIKGNHIKMLQEGAFGDLGSLKRLVFTYNKLKTIESNAFIGLGQLLHLDLRWNELVLLQTHGFSGLFGLKKLDLDFNKIHSIAEWAFRDLNLTKLGLENNPYLTDMSPDAFQDSAISEVFIYGSNLSSSSVSAFRALKNSLQELYWQENQQPVILPVDTFEGFKFIKLNLDNNGISDASFVKHISTDDLSLVGNPIGPIDFSRYSLLHTVRALHLDSTNFSQFDQAYFSSLHQLEILHVQNNGITTISDGLKSIFSKLKSLKLEGNPLHCNCELIWLKDWLTLVSGSHVDVTGAECSTPFVNDVSSADAESMLCSVPRLINITSRVTVRYGSHLNITCTAEGDPTPQISWELPDGRIKTYPPSLNRTETVAQKTYQLKNAKWVDAGAYRCVAANLRGNDSAIVVVEVSSSSSTSSSSSFLLTDIGSKMFNMFSAFCCCLFCLIYVSF